MIYIGLDIGTTGSKATAIDGNGSVKASAYGEYPALRSAQGYAEIDANAVWQTVKNVISRAAKSCGGDVAAIAIASLGESYVLLDKNDRVLMPSMLCSDIRGTDEIRDILEQITEQELFDLSGMPINAMYSLNKLVWTRINRPELLEAASKILFFEDYIYYMLSGCRNVDYSLASRTMFFDYKQKKWSRRILELFDIDEAKLSRPVPTGSVIGKVSAKIAGEVGLSPDTKLVAGAHDQVCAALGAGVLSHGECVDGIGTSECITTMLGSLDQAAFMRANKFCIEPYAIENEYVTLAFTMSGAATLRWYRDTFETMLTEQLKKTSKSAYPIMEMDCPKGPTGLFVLPHFAGSGTPYMDPYSKGAILGLSLSTSKGEIYKACMEGMCFEMLYNAELLSNVGTNLTSMTCTGGGARSDMLLQVKADIMGIPVKRLKAEESGTLALAMLCSTACGDFASLQEAAGQLVKVDKEFYPNGSNQETYTQKYDTYKKIYKQMKELGI